MLPSIRITLLTNTLAEVLWFNVSSVLLPFCWYIFIRFSIIVRFWHIKWVTTLITPQNWLERFWQCARGNPRFGLIGDSLKCGANFTRKRYGLVLKRLRIQKSRCWPLISADKPLICLKLIQKDKIRKEVSIQYALKNTSFFKLLSSYVIIYQLIKYFMWEGSLIVKWTPNQGLATIFPIIKVQCSI